MFIKYFIALIYVYIMLLISNDNKHTLSWLADRTGGEAITASTVIDSCRGNWLLKLGDLVIKAGGPGY